MLQLYTPLPVGVCDGEITRPSVTAPERLASLFTSTVVADLLGYLSELFPRFFEPWFGISHVDTLPAYFSEMVVLG